MVLDEINNYKEYYEGLQNALIPNPQLISQIAKDDEDLLKEYNLDSLQELIQNNPDDEGLLNTIQNDDDGLILYLYLFVPLSQVLEYTTKNCLPNFSDLSFAPKFTLFDADSICDELGRLTKRGREQVFNYYYEINFKYAEKLKIAITEPNVELLKEIIDSKEVDLLWLQRALGYFRYGREINECIINGTTSDDMVFPLFKDFVKSTVNEDTPYEGELYRILTLEQEDSSIFVFCGLLLKYYWYIYSIFTEKTRNIIDSYINKTCFKTFVSKCREEFEEEDRQRAEKTTEGEIEAVDVESVVEETQNQASQSAYIDEKEKIFTFAPNVNAVNLFPESEYAFNGSKGLAEYAINNKEKIECFVHLVTNKFHYIPKDKKQARAFVRTLTGIKCDGGIIKPILQSREAVEAILYMAQRHILPGNLKDALQKFDFKEDVDIKPMKKNPSSYAKRADSEFVKLVADVFGDYCGQK